MRRGCREAVGSRAGAMRLDEKAGKVRANPQGFEPLQLTGIRSGYFDRMRSASDFLRSIGCSLLNDMTPGGTSGFTTVCC